MALADKWWVWCVASLFCLARLGSCRKHPQANEAPPERFIFNELCALKDEPGHCKAIKERYFFNVETGKCELFEYGGCGGNANNFESLEQCEKMCVVSDDKDPCHLPEAPGPCRGLVMRYLFDSKSQQCRHFFYGGCFGNANNFNSMAECQAKCQNPAKPSTPPEVHTQPIEESVVKPTIVTGDLTVIIPAVQVKSTSQKTSALVAEDVCSSPVERGTCDRNVRRFAYNAEINRCRPFHYSGCGGNGNNFSFRRECYRKCANKRKDLEREGVIRVKRKNLPNYRQNTA